MLQGSSHFGFSRTSESFVSLLTVLLILVLRCGFFITKDFSILQVYINGLYLLVWCMLQIKTLKIMSNHCQCHYYITIRGKASF